MEKFLTVERAKKLYELGVKVYAVELNADGDAQHVVKCVGDWTFDWVLEWDEDIKRRDSGACAVFMTLSQLRRVGNVLCCTDEIDIIVKACDI